MMTDLQLIQASFDLWIHTNAADNLADLDRAKRMLPIVLEECVTVTQQKYILNYYIDQMTTAEIAEIYGVDRSTVSRTIRRGLNKAYGYLRFVSPLFIKPPHRREPLKNGKKPDRRGGKRQT